MAAYSIVNTLKDLAQLGCTVISTIHQASAKTLRALSHTHTHPLSLSPPGALSLHLSACPRARSRSRANKITVRPNKGTPTHTVFAALIPTTLTSTRNPQSPPSYSPLPKYSTCSTVYSSSRAAGSSSTDQLMVPKRALYRSKRALYRAKKSLCQCPRSPISSSREPCITVKRALYHAPKSPTKAHHAPKSPTNADEI